MSGLTEAERAFMYRVWFRQKLLMAGAFPLVGTMLVLIQLGDFLLTDALIRSKVLACVIAVAALALASFYFPFISFLALPTAAFILGRMLIRQFKIQRWRDTLILGIIGLGLGAAYVIVTLVGIFILGAALSGPVR